MLNDLSLLLNLKRSSLQLISIASLVRLLVRERNQVRRICEEIIHLFKWKTLGFWQDEVEEKGVREIADDEEEIVSVTEFGHCDVGDLSDHGVECKGDHGSNRNTLRTSFGVKDFSRNDPRERSACGGEGEIVCPSANDESP